MGEPNKQPDEPAADKDQKPNKPLVANLQLEVNEQTDPDGGDEFTLETLSEAYADVMRSEDSEGDATEDEGPEADSADDDALGSSIGSDENDDAACPISPESIVESILFVGAPSDVKLTSRKIASVLRDVSPKEVAQIVKKLNSRYTQQDAAWRIASDDGNYRMVLDASLEPFRDEFFGRNREVKLNQSAVDVLAVVAYHQPATLQEIDKIRGKKSSSVLNQLVKRQLLVREQSEETPTRKEYRTTDRFLDLFGLTEIECAVKKGLAKTRGQTPQSQNVFHRFSAKI
jgi:segregation and condensation protein B